MLAGELQLLLLAKEGELLLEVADVLERVGVLHLPASHGGRTPHVTTVWFLLAARA
jgi:hypothetical protein